VTVDESLEASGLDIQAALDQMEDMILSSPSVPLTGKTLVDEEELVQQLDLSRLNLPDAFAQAKEILRQRHEILAEAEEYAEEIAARAEQRAQQIMNALGIVRQAELQAQQVRQNVQQECEALQDKTLQEIEQVRQRAQQDLNRMREEALAEQDSIRQGADEYADQVLADIERRLSDMLQVIHNGRSHLDLGPNAVPKDKRMSSGQRPAR
jgi:vacuolar-type H+-ATPase subunit H